MDRVEKTCTRGFTVEIPVPKKKMEKFPSEGKTQFKKNRF